MHAWPSHHHLPKQTKKKKKFLVKNYPVLDHGIIGAATLVERNGKLEWDSLVSAHPAANRYRLTKTLDIFPATKSAPILEPAVTVARRADQGAHFLRTHFPEVDVSAGVIRNQIVESAFQTAELAKFDPFEGNILDIVTDNNERTWLAFPMGELSNELNLTPILAANNGRTVIRPTTRPGRTFSTPIQQITPSPRGILFAVRTFGAASLFKFDSEPSSIGHLTDITHLTSHDVGGVPIMDVKIPSTESPFEVLLTNRKGGIYGCSLFGGKKTMVELRADLDLSTPDTFWRLGQGNKPIEYTVLSGKSLGQLDFRTNQVTPLFTEESNAFLTSVEDYAQDNIIRLCSTSQIIWLDPRVPGKPLLGYEHHRQFDRTLHTTTTFVNCSLTTFLTSKHNDLVTIYNISQQEGQPIRANDSPYSISPPKSHSRYPGEAFLQRGSCDVTVFRIDERAQVHCLELCNTSIGDLGNSHAVIAEKSDAVKELGKNAGNTKSNLQKYGDQDKSIANLYPAYDRVFRLHAEKQEKVEEEQVEEFYDLMDRLPTFWQTYDAPVEHMLTSYDIAFRSQENPNRILRSDFAAGSLVHSARGFLALSQNRFPYEGLRRGASWHVNIADIQNRIDPSLGPDMSAHELAESLHMYDLMRDDSRTEMSIRRENDAREQLAVDLVLSRDVYSPSAFAPPSGVRDDLETMTEALSLGEHDIDEPPEMEFGYLNPVVKVKGMEHYKEKELEETEAEQKENNTGKVSVPVGVRSLLREWEVGTKVQDYVFRDPYNNSSEEFAPQTTIRPIVGRAGASMSQPIQSQRPPAVMTSRTMDGGARLGSSQPLSGFVTDGKIGVESQEGMASTQVLPGVYGGRVVKKAVKKRMGGF